jgi:3-dehydroquinate dehydratase-2
MEDVVPTVTLAKLYEKQGLLDKAAAVYRKLICLQPERVDYAEALREVERTLPGHGIDPGAGTGEATTVLPQLQKWQEAILTMKRALDHVDTFGLRETALLQNSNLDQLNGDIRRAAEEFGMSADTFQADREEVLVQKIREAADDYDVLVICPEELAFTGSALRDVLATLDIPIVEVHPSNTSSLGPSRGSLIADVVTAHLSGFGRHGYVMAIRAAANMAAKEHGARGRVRGA